MINNVLPVIDPDLCNGCGECVDACPEEALVIVDGIAVLASDEADCTYCGACEEACQTEAICCPYEIVVEG